jgi:hypothetical protein
MTRRPLAWIAAVVLGAVAIAGALWSAFGTNRVVLTDAQLQERINRQLPHEVKGVTIERATVTIAENQIALRVEVRASALGRTFATAAFARGIPRYDAERGEVFFDADDVKLENFTMGDSAGRADQPGGRLGALVGENLTRIKTVAGSTIAAGVKAYLAARPVYRFKDDLKGVVLKAAITDVAIEGNAVAIGVSLFNLSVMVAVCLLALLVIVVIVVQLIRHPAWGARRQASRGADEAPAQSGSIHPTS